MAAKRHLEVERIDLNALPVPVKVAKETVRRRYTCRFCASTFTRSHLVKTMQLSFFKTCAHCINMMQHTVTDGVVEPEEV